MKDAPGAQHRSLRRDCYMARPLCGLVLHMQPRQAASDVKLFNLRQSPIFAAFRVACLSKPQVVPKAAPTLLGLNAFCRWGSH